MVAAIHLSKVIIKCNKKLPDKWFIGQFFIMFLLKFLDHNFIPIYSTPKNSKNSGLSKLAW